MGSDKLDTALARQLHKSGRMDLGTLQACLSDVRRTRGSDQPRDLAEVILDRGLLSPEELGRHLTAIGGRPVREPAPTPEKPAPERPTPEQAIAEQAIAEPPIAEPPIAPPKPPVVTPDEAAAAAAAVAAEVAHSHAVTLPLPVPTLEPPPRPVAAPAAAPLPAPAPTRPPGATVAEPARRATAPVRGVDRLLPGTRLGEWIVSDCLGTGGMGSVYRATHAEQRGEYALKTLRAVDDVEDRLRLQREVEAQERFPPHPNLARIRTWGLAGGIPFLVLDLAPGGSLQDRLRRGSLPLPDALRVLLDVARGLAHLHAHGVVHRDLKPGNVLFGREGEAKLADFGLARFEGARSLTQTGTLLGTPGFMPPEALRNEPLTEPGDVYSLGCLVHACLTGSAPFRASNPVGALVDAATVEPPALREVLPTTPEWLDALCRRMLQRDPAARPSAGEVVAALEEGAAAHLRPPGRGSRLRALALATCAGLGGLALGVAGAGGRIPGWPAQLRADRAGPGGAAPLASASPTPPATPSPAEAERAPALALWEFPPGRLPASLELRGTVLLMPDLVARITRRYTLGWQAEALDARRIEVLARIEGLELRWTSASIDAPFRPPPLPPEALSSLQGGERDALSDPALQPLQGASFRLVFDRGTGRLLEVRGASELQTELFRRAPAVGHPLRVLYNFPELGAPDVFTRLLESPYLVLTAGQAQAAREGGSGDWWELRYPPLASEIPLELLCRAHREQREPLTVTWSGERDGLGLGGPATRRCEGRFVVEQGWLRQVKLVDQLVPDGPGLTMELEVGPGGGR